MRRPGPKTPVHSSKGRLVVTRMEPRSQRWLNTSKRSFAPVGDRGTNPNSSTISRLRRDSCRRRFSRRLSSLASISSWTRAAAVLTPPSAFPAGAAGAGGDDVFTALDASAPPPAISIARALFTDGMAGRSKVSRLFHCPGSSTWREMIGGNSQAADLIMRRNGLFRARKPVSAETGG